MPGDRRAPVAAAPRRASSSTGAGTSRAGGLPPGDDLDVAAVELCARARRAGSSSCRARSSSTTGRCRRSRDLRGPIDPGGPAWRAAVGRSGPALLRRRPDRTSGGATVRPHGGGTVGEGRATLGRLAPRRGSRGGLRRLGHEVRLQTADQGDDPAGRSCDVHLVLRGLRPVRRSAGQRHVLWIISHPEAIEDDELDDADLVLVASPPVRRSSPDADRHAGRGAPPGHRPAPLPTSTRRSGPPASGHGRRQDPGRARGPWSPTPSPRGSGPASTAAGWTELVDPDLVVADHVDNEVLPIVYSSAGVVLNDHWRTMQAWGFVSNRLYDVLACGTPGDLGPGSGPGRRCSTAPSSSTTTRRSSESSWSRCSPTRPWPGSAPSAVAPWCWPSIRSIVAPRSWSGYLGRARRRRVARWPIGPRGTEPEASCILPHSLGKGGRCRT